MRSKAKQSQAKWFLLGLSLFCASTLSSNAFGYDTELLCAADGPGSRINCFTEDFSTYSIPTFFGTSFTSPNGFYFEQVSGGSQFQTMANNGLNDTWLFIPGTISAIWLPQPSNIVTFALSGEGVFEIAGFDASGNRVTTVVESVFDQVKAVRLGPGADPIEYFLVFHIDQSACELDPAEPLITDIVACDQ